MYIVKLNNHRAIKWFVMDNEHQAIAGFTTKKAAQHAMESYRKRWGDE